MAVSKYQSTRETTNFARIARIILGPCTHVLQDVLTKEIPPSALSHKVKTFIANIPKNRKPPISKVQEQLVYGGNYSDFDITLLYFLLRNVCSIPPHTKQWGNDPNPGDRSVSANIERIRILRNEYYGHITHFLLSNADFEQKWKKIFQIIIELEIYLGTDTRYQDALTELRTCSMDPDVEMAKIQKLIRVVVGMLQIYSSLKDKEKIDVFNEDNSIFKKGVKKTGRTTGLRFGHMESIRFEKPHGSNNRFPFYNLYVVDKVAGEDQLFFKPGDSGSGVFVVEDGQPDKALRIGIAIAMFSQETYVCKIAKILNTLGLTIVRYRKNNQEQTLPSTVKM